MIFIYGGSWQGKLDFAKAQYGLEDGEIQICDEATEALDAGARCLAYVEKWALNRVRAGVDVLMPGGNRTGKRVPDGTLLETLGQPEGITTGELQRTAKHVLAFALDIANAEAKEE